jgi:hypothetical protein
VREDAGQTWPLLVAIETGEVCRKRKRKRKKKRRRKKRRERSRW